MIWRKFILAAALLLGSLAARAQVDLKAEFFSIPDTLTNEYLDSVTVQKLSPNNYWMVGAYGGATFNYGLFNPTRYTRWMVQYPVVGFSVIRYYTMFGIFPNMGLEFGAQLGHEGYEFKVNKETGEHTSTESGAYKIYMRVPEVFFLTHFHGDLTEHFTCSYDCILRSIASLHNCIAKNIDTRTRATPSTAANAASTAVMLLLNGDIVRVLIAVSKALLIMQSQSYTQSSTVSQSIRSISPTPFFYGVRDHTVNIS